ncbi:MAG: hypothetical protein KBT36_12480 [Kurthia sp.]|nr:hypothetical protein [Candidatus Kurthia equi]
MNWWLIASLIVGMICFILIVFLFITRLRKYRIQKQRNYIAIEARFKKKNRSSKGSPY